MPQRRPRIGELSALHRAVLALAFAGCAETADDVARALDLPVDDVHRACIELEAAGWLTWVPPRH